MRFSWRSRPDDTGLTSASTWPLLSALLVMIALVVPAVAPVQRSTVALLLVNVAFVVGLQAFVGNTGIFSFGHVAFMGIGAYTTAILTIPLRSKHVLYPTLPQVELPGPLAILAAVVVCAFFALGLALVLSNLAGLVASLGTFAFLNIFYNVAVNLEGVTGGSTGLTGIPREKDLTLVTVLAIVAVGAGLAYSRSRWGRRMRAVRDDDVAAAALGIRGRSGRVLAFAISASIAGASGGAYALTAGSITPTSFFLTATLATTAMLVVGGRLRVTGAVVGVIALTAVQEVLRLVEGVVALPGLQETVFALLLVVVLILRPLGIVGDKDWVVRLEPASAMIRGRIHA